MTDELYEKLTRLQWLLHRQQLRNYADNGPMVDTTRGQGRILAILKLKDNISTKDLSYLLGVQVSSLNETLAKLEKNEYIVRKPSEQDKRIILVELTEKGREMKKPDANRASSIFDCLSNKEQKNLSRYLDSMITSLTESVGFDNEEFEHLVKNRENLIKMLNNEHLAHREFHDILRGMRRDGFTGYHGFMGFSGRKNKHHEHD